MKIFKIIICLLVSATILSACGQESAVEKSSILKGDKVLMVIAPKDFSDLEYSGTRKALEDRGAEVKVASIQKIEAKGENGLAVAVDEIAGSLNLGYYEAVVFIGGPGMAMIIRDDTLRNLAINSYHSGKIVAAIGIGPAIMARAGILSGKKAAGWEKTQGDTSQGGGKYSKDAVVADGSLVTANGSDSAALFGEAISKALAARHK